MNCLRDRRTSRWVVVVATAVAGGVLLASGTGYRVLEGYLARPVDSVPMPPGTLARLPMRIGGWVGQNAPMSAAMIRATDTDDLISRRYSRGGGLQSVWLYVAYGVRARDLSPHRPEVCYPGAGWTLEGNRVVELGLGDGSKLPCRIFRFARAGLDARSIVVLNYYIVDGQYCADVSLLRSRLWRGPSAIRYMAQVQITCAASGTFSEDGAIRSVSTFAVESARPILMLLPSPNKDMSGDGA